MGRLQAEEPGAARIDPDPRDPRSAEEDEEGPAGTLEFLREMTRLRQEEE